MMTSKIRHEWFQNDQFVSLDVFIKQVKKETVTVEFGEKSVGFTISAGGINGSGDSSSTEIVFDVSPLAHAIVPSESKWSVLSTKIEIKLKKAMVGLKWAALEGVEETTTTATASDASAIMMAAAASVAATAPPAYPSSSKKTVNWDQLAKQADAEKPEGEQALNALFQQIYKDATPETQRAMIKSFTESNGTCLSTNWEEVGGKRVEVTPPEGMVAKPFEK